MNNLPKVEREAPWPGIEPATSRLQVQRPNQYATTPHYQISQLISVIKFLSEARCQIFRLKCAKFNFGWSSARPRLVGGTAPRSPRTYHLSALRALILGPSDFDTRYSFLFRAKLPLPQTYWPRMYVSVVYRTW